VVARAVVAVIAVLVLAWLGLMERDVRFEARGTHLSAQLAVRGNVARADAELRAAQRLNPDTAPELKRAFLYVGARRPADAASILEGILRREPDNLAAWGALFNVARDRDPVAADRALAARRRLDPLRAPPPR
jgi:predicted Zn-dependent protease